MDEEQLSSWPWIISVFGSKGYCSIVMPLCVFQHRRVTYVKTDDVDQSVLSSIRFELVANKRTVRTTQYRITMFVVLNNIYDSVGKFEEFDFAYLVRMKSPFRTSRMSSK